MSVIIRIPVGADVEAIHDVYHKTWMATYPNAELGILAEDVAQLLPPVLSPEKREKQLAYYAAIPPHRCMFVATFNEVIAGVCAGEKTTEHNHLRSIYVLPEYQGQGVGYLLWQAFAGWSDADNKTIVHVATYNEQAIDFYTKLGFVDTKKRFAEERFRLKSGAIIPELEMERHPVVI